MPARRIACLGVLVALVAASMLMPSVAAQSQGEWGLCAAGPLIPPRPPFEVPSHGPDTLDAIANEAEMHRGGQSVLRGDVLARRRNMLMHSDVLTYDEPTALVSAEGDVKVWNDDMYLTSDQAQLALDTNETTIERADFALGERHGRGAGERVVISDSRLLRAKHARYTTCDPGADAWVLTASSVKLDNATKVGEAWNALVKFKGVPIFYSPYLQFPLSNERKSGFLTPSAGVSKETGYEASIPYYWNIAPNMDATFTPRGMTRRGGLLGAQFRYLTHADSGTIEGEYLPYDLVRNDTRWAVHGRHTTRFSSRLRADIDAAAVSDDQYLQQLGTNLAIASTSFLDQRGDLTYSGRGWWTRLRAQHYQTIDETVAKSDEPYARLPQLVAATSLPERNRRPNLGAYGEFVSFERDVGPTAARGDLHATLSYPWRSAAAFAIPSANLRYTRYQLYDSAGFDDRSPDRLIPTASFDSGLFFERNVALGGASYVQTLEPRLFYLYVPFESQTDLPVFDTGTFTFGFDQLFRDNRFTGADRVGDANQLSIALSSRLLTPSGGELGRLSLGQIRYFRNRKVTLPGEAPGTESGSPLVADLSASLASWRFLGGIQWDPTQTRVDRGTAAVRYEPDPERVLNLSYRYLRGSIDQTDMSFRWPVSERFAVVGRWNYAVPQKRTLDGVAGIEYQSCCWALRAVARHYVNDVNAGANNAFFVQLELKGLAGIGKAAGQLVERSVPGYEPGF
jgi:LPS-assembly protein